MCVNTQRPGKDTRYLFSPSPSYLLALSLKFAILARLAG